MLVDIEKIKIKERARKDFGNLKELADDIKENGLINPPVVNRDFELLAGERRLRACKVLGWKQIVVNVMDTRDLEHELNIELSENESRLAFSKSERYELMKNIFKIQEEKARERQGHKTSDRNLTDVVRADEETAKQFGISRDTMRKEMVIVENKELLDPQDFADWDDGKLSTNKAYQKIKQELNKEKEHSEALQREIQLKNADLTIAQNEVKALKERPQREIVKEVVKEVIPDDYEDIKSKAKCFEDDFHHMQKAYEEMAEKWKKAEREKSQVEAAWQSEKENPQEQVRQSALFFCAGIANFLEKYGGYIWLADHINELPDEEKRGFFKGIEAIDNWVRQLRTNLGEVDL